MISARGAHLQQDSRSRDGILAVDYGRKRLGLALSSGGTGSVRPLAVWTRTNRREDLIRLRELCRLHGVGFIVVGWPLHLDGTAGEMAAEAQSFADRIRKHLGLRVELVDERLSSWEAAQLTLENKAAHSTRNQVGRRDDVAAAVILRDYLSRPSRSAHR